MEIGYGELRRILGKSYQEISDKIRPTININQKYTTHISKRKKFKISEKDNAVQKIIQYKSKDDKNTGYGFHKVLIINLVTRKMVAYAQ